jgi:hypothetical protein
MSLKNTFNSDNTCWRASRVTAAPCFSFRHLSIMIARTVRRMRYLSRAYFPEVTNSCKNSSLRLLISLILRVETFSRLALLLVLNFFSSECSFSLAKNAEYYWLIALTPFRISSRSLNKSPPYKGWGGLSSSKSWGAGVISVTSGFKGWLSSISIKA